METLHVNQDSPLIGKIQRIPLRNVWNHEAHCFTVWLSENMDVLGDVLGFDLSLVEREARAGDFSLDLLAEDSDGRTIVIENQLARSDHDHLGKLVTYLAAFEAPIAVWIVGEPRPEHTKAVAWLNDSSEAEFHLLRAEAIRVDESKHALLLTPIVGPSREAKAVAKEKREKSERHELRRAFWTDLLNSAREQRFNLHNNISPGDSNYVGTSAGQSGLFYNYVIRKGDWRVELYIDVGDPDKNAAIFKRLAQRRSEIDSACEATLQWEPLEGKQACRVTTPWNQSGGYHTAAEAWPDLHAEMVEAMGRLHAALDSHVQSLPR
jgi:hypothetical protein